MSDIEHYSPALAATMDKDFFRSLSPVNFDLANAAQDDVKYKLFTEPNQKEGDVITTETVGERIKNKDIPTVFIMHGWTTDDTSPWFTPLKDALLKSSPHNVIFVNWQKAGNKSYNESTANIEPVGEYIAEFLVETKVDPDLIHLVGTSLGAHLAGCAARRYRALRGAKIGRVSGLDPAGPKFWHPVMEAKRLGRADAAFVDVVHSDAGYYGHAAPLGHADFYPNGGTHQPGCPARKKDDNCSHARCTLYYVESVSRKTYAEEVTYKEVQGSSEFSLELVKNGRKAVFGHHADLKVHGIFQFETESEAPFLRV